MKRFPTLLAALAMLLSLAACGEGGLSLKLGGGDDVILPDKDGVAAGYEGDTLRTAFFDMKLENPATSTEFDGLVPDPGWKFLTADLTHYNYTDHSQPIYDSDFNILWETGSGDDADVDGDWPLYEEIMDEDGSTSYTTKSDRQMPVEFSLGIHQTRTELLLFQVPEDVQDFYVVFEELYEDGTEEGSYGDIFYFRFSA